MEPQIKPNPCIEFPPEIIQYEFNQTACFVNTPTGTPKEIKFPASLPPKIINLTRVSKNAFPVDFFTIPDKLKVTRKASPPTPHRNIDFPKKIIINHEQPTTFADKCRMLIESQEENCSANTKSDSDCSLPLINTPRSDIADGHYFKSPAMKIIQKTLKTSNNINRSATNLKIRSEFNEESFGTPSNQNTTQSNFGDFQRQEKGQTIKLPKVVVKQARFNQTKSNSNKGFSNLTIRKDARIQL